MLVNYFKLALKVLARNKFFTAISLFGISFTLMILMLITAFYDAEFGKNKPLSQKDKMVFLAMLKMQKMDNDTIWQIDSSLLDGKMIFDSTLTTSENASSTSTSGFGYHFLDKYLRAPEDVQSYSFFTSGSSFDVFLNNSKFTISAMYTDAEYWNIMDFPMLVGNVFSNEHVEGATRVAVITDHLAGQYFGTSKNVIGEEVEMGDTKYKVIGVIERPRTNNEFVASDIFIPYTTMDDRTLSSKEYLGGFSAVYLAGEASQIPLIKEELATRTANAMLPDPEEFNRISTIPLSIGELYASQIVDYENPARGLFLMRLIFGSLMLFFVMLPTLNLINLNVSRIMERSAEIGVRKAFGANSSTILFQFIFENIIITVIGGLIGLTLALLLFYLINDSQVLPFTILRFNLRVFIYSLVVCLLFGIVSGLLPAWKVSRLQITNALKSNQL